MLDKFMSTEDTNNTTRKPKTRKARNPKNGELETKSLISTFKNPIFVVQSYDCKGEGSLIAITQSFSSAYGNLYLAIHDAGRKSEKEAEKEILEKGYTQIFSITSNHLHCLISIHELIP